VASPPTCARPTLRLVAGRDCPRRPGSAPSTSSAEPTEAEALASGVRRLIHRLNNDLALPVGVLELLAERPDLPPNLRELVQDARRGIAAATQHLGEFRRLLQSAHAPR